MKADRQAPIGVFDSGVGGLTVVREIMRNLPDERIVYFGDTARVPYGSKSKNTVIRYSRQIVHFLETQQVKAIVIACNTASALALDTIEKEIDLPIIGVVKPGAQMAVETTQNKRVGVIATESTIQSGLYQQLITEADPAITVYGKPCPLFVPLVEVSGKEQYPKYTRHQEMFRTKPDTDRCQNQEKRCDDNHQHRLSHRGKQTIFHSLSFSSL